MAKNQAKAKRSKLSNTLRLKFLIFENYSLFSTPLLSKKMGDIVKSVQKTEHVCLNEVIWLMTMEMRTKMKNRSHRCDINRPRSRHGHKYSKYKMWLSIMIAICIKQKFLQLFCPFFSKCLHIHFNPSKNVSPIVLLNGLVMVTNEGSNTCKCFKRGKVREYLL